MLRWQTADTFQYHMHGSRTGHKHISVPRHQVPSLYHPPPYDLIHLLQTPSVVLANISESQMVLEKATALQLFSEEHMFSL